MVSKVKLVREGLKRIERHDHHRLSALAEASHRARHRGGRARGGGEIGRRAGLSIRWPLSQGAGPLSRLPLTGRVGSMPTRRIISTATGPKITRP
jgi:hypothetical protein